MLGALVGYVMSSDELGWQFAAMDTAKTGEVSLGLGRIVAVS
jgi:hypothetical protein